jgi:hypothetical protein
LGGYYTIGKLEIQTELVPTSQSGTINVIDIGQANSQNVVVNPEDQQNDREQLAKGAALALSLTKELVLPTIGPFEGLGVGQLCDGYTSMLYDFVGESINGFDTYANGPSDYYTRITWTYRDVDTHVRDAVGSNYINWHYLRGHGEYRLKISATITWDKWVNIWFIWPQWWHYSGVGTTTIVDYIDV